jgi:predicted dehydrogenase
MTEMSRRNFLRTAVAGAAVSNLTSANEIAGAPAILTSTVVGDPVRYGFIGTGSRGTELLRSLSAIPTGRCLATCDIYPVNLKKGVQTIGGNPQTYEDYRQLLARKDIDAVFIATPLHLHAQMLIDSLNAGKHVFIEKTMFFKEQELEPIRKAAASHPKQVLQVGLQRRSSVLYKIAMDMIAKGALGKITFVRAQWHRNNNWRRPVADPKLERQINWRMYREYSGGLMAELGSHQIDVANWALGAEPVSVTGTGGINYWKDGRETCDNVQAIFEYPGGQKLLYSSILCNAHYDFNEQIMGDRGTLEITIGKGMYFREQVPTVSTGPSAENWWAGATVTKGSAQNGFPIIPTASGGQQDFIDREIEYGKRWLASMGIYNYHEPHDPAWTQLENFFASIREAKPVIAPIEVGVADALGVIYANRAIDTSQKVFWPKKQA